MSGKQDSEKLMNELFQFAKKMLNQYGEFHPFGGYLNNSDIVVHVGIESGTSQDKVMRLKSSFKKLANEKRQGLWNSNRRNLTI